MMKSMCVFLKYTIAFWFLIIWNNLCSQENKKSDLKTDQESKIGLSYDYGISMHYGNPIGIYSFNELLVFKFQNPFVLNAYWTIKKRKFGHEFGISFLQKKGETTSNSGYINCDTQNYLITVNYLAEFNYLNFNYGIEIPVSKEKIFITFFTGAGRSFESLIYKNISPDNIECYQTWNGYDPHFYETAYMFEFGAKLNYQIIQKKKFNFILRARGSFRGMSPRHDIFIGVGTSLEFKLNKV